jgi:CRISPR-associated protein Cas2
MHLVVCYDITDDRRRYHVARILDDYGDRVQYSVFEIIMDEHLLPRMTRRLENAIDREKDSVRIYLLCARCEKNISVMGKATIIQESEVYIV